MVGVMVSVKAGLPKKKSSSASHLHEGASTTEEGFAGEILGEGTKLRQPTSNVIL
jgi:hypothetical protein